MPHNRFSHKAYNLQRDGDSTAQKSCKLWQNWAQGKAMLLTLTWCWVVWGLIADSGADHSLHYCRFIFPMVLVENCSNAVENQAGSVYGGK